MTRLYNAQSFKLMPWKNGGGQSTELFRLENPQEDGQFFFRLSCADIFQDGPFSLYPGIDRTLVLLSSNGIKLKFPDHEKKLTKIGDLINFPGETAIACQLLMGPSQDFNVMVDRRWGRATVIIYPSQSSETFFRASSDSFVFLPQSSLLWHLLPEESVQWPADDLAIVIVITRAPS